MPTALPHDVVLRARTGVYVVFALAGVLFAAFASRIPDAKASLDLTAGELGLTLLGISVGSLLGLPTAGWLVNRYGAARTVLTAVGLAVVGVTVAGLGIDAAQSRALTTFGLILTGLGVGSWDAAMNIEGAEVERHLDWTIMPRLHAAFSGGTVVSALIGAGLSRLGVPILAHLIGVGLLVAILAAWCVRRFLPRSVEVEHDDDTAAGDSVFTAWREPKTLLIGFVMLAAAFTEGTANDWISVAFVEGHDLEPWAGVLGLATFLTFMTVGRIAGSNLLDRYGRVPMLRATFALAVVGAGLVVFGNATVAFIGAALWGMGASLGFPVGMSAAADDPKRAAARVSVVSTIAYVAFLGGPPLLGLLGDHVGVLRSLLVVGGMVALALFCVQVTREEAAAETAPASGEIPAPR